MRRDPLLGASLGLTGLALFFGVGVGRQDPAACLRLRTTRRGAAAWTGRPLEPARAARRLRAAARALAEAPRRHAARVRLAGRARAHVLAWRPRDGGARRRGVP